MILCSLEVILNNVICSSLIRPVLRLLLLPENSVGTAFTFLHSKYMICLSFYTCQR